MRTRVVFPILLSVIALTGFFYFISQASRTVVPDPDWQIVAPGIEYQKFYIPASDPDNLGPNYVYVARMDRTNLNVTVDSTIAQGRLSGGVEQISGMSNRYEDTINYWGQSWGKRNNVAVAINGYYFGAPIEPSGVPWRGQIQSGWYAKRFDDNHNGSGFVWKLDRSAFIGECVYHQPNKQIVAFTGTTTSTVKIDDINTARGDDELILFTPQYDLSTLTDNGGVEILVEMERPTMILPPSLAYFSDLSPALQEFIFPDSQPDNPDSFAKGYVRAIRDNQGNTTIPFDYVVLSATGVKRTKLLENLSVGMEVDISQGINHYDKDDCTTSITTSKDWTKAYAAVGGHFYFLENNVINGYYDDGQATVHEARTAIAYSPNYIFYIVVDRFDYPYGSGTTISKGMNMAELGYFARETLGATDGISQDSGGSSTMVINGQVVNTPRFNPSSIVPGPCSPIPTVFTSTELLSSYLPLIYNQNASPPTPIVTPSPTPSPTPTSIPGICYTSQEPYVANGMMMVVVEPMTTSTTFTPTQAVLTTLDANLRTGPGTNYPVMDTIPNGTHGTVIVHNNGLNGVYATGFNWWYVDFGSGLVGWISESVLAGGG